MISPCYKCKKRHAACWSDCKEYHEWKQELDDGNMARKKEKKERAMLQIRKK